MTMCTKSVHKKLKSPARTPLEWAGRLLRWSDLLTPQPWMIVSNRIWGCLRYFFSPKYQFGRLQHCQQLGQLLLFQHICEFLGGVGDDDVADDVDDPVGRHDVGHDQLDALHGEVVLVVPFEEHKVPEQVVGSCTALDHT